MSDDAQYWDGYQLNPDGTIHMEAIVDYGILTVPSGVIFQFYYAGSQADIDSGNLKMVQLHMGPHHMREYANEILRAADKLGA